MASQSPSAAVDALFALFASYGSSDYVGEAVSQEQHARQCAALATAAGAPPAVIAGALCHDVGHMLGLQHPERYSRMDDCGVVAHEGVGAAWLETLGFPRAAANIVRRHVDAKRYLVYKDPSYELSPASRVTLGFQGGPMSPEEAASFEASGEKDTILTMRKWDEAAKDPLAQVPSLESYRPMLEALVAANNAGAAA